MGIPGSPDGLVVTAVFNFPNTKIVDLPGDPLQPADEFHLEAASGWIGLGDFDSAREELAQIPHPDAGSPGGSLGSLRVTLCG